MSGRKLNVQKSMIHTLPATKVKNSFGDIIKHVYAAGDQVIVEKAGIPVVAIIPISDYEPLYQKQGGENSEIDQKISHAGNMAQANRQLRKAQGGNNGKGGEE